MKLARKRAKSGRKFKKKGDDVRNPKTWNLEEKREVAKLAIVGSMIMTVATSFVMRNRTMRRLHIGAGAALVGIRLCIKRANAVRRVKIKNPKQSSLKLKRLMRLKKSAPKER